MSTLSPTAWALVTAIFVTWTGWQLLSARIWPWTACRHCSGGRHLDQGGRGTHWRLCRKCKGKGAKLRLLYRLLWQRGTSNPAIPK